MPIKLFLDDVRAPSTPGWDVVRSYDAFVKYYEENDTRIPELVSFDHDLSPEHYPNLNHMFKQAHTAKCPECGSNNWEPKLRDMLCTMCRHCVCYEKFYSLIDLPYKEFREKTGYDCAAFLVEKQLFPKRAIIHSWNPPGARNIANLLAPHCKVYIDPYPSKLVF